MKFRGLLCLLLLSLLLWEGILRLAVVSPAKVNHDPQLGAMKAAYADILRTYEGFSRFQTDEFGLNNDVSFQANQQHRLLVLGDSFVEAEQVMRADNFVAQLHALEGVSAYNAGYSGADPRAFSIVLERVKAKAKPTLLVLCVNGGDLSALTQLELPKHQPPEGVKRWLQPIFANSALATHLNWKYKPELLRWWQAKKAVDFAGAVAVKNGSAARQQLQHWRMILQRLQATKLPILIVFPPSINYTTSGVQPAKSPALNRMAKIALALDIDVIRTEQAFADDFSRSHKVALGFHNSQLGTGHFNQRGHDIVTTLIGQYLTAQP